MFRSTSLLGLSIFLCLVSAKPTLASPWENLFSSTSGTTEARVDMESHSFKRIKLSGESVIKARLSMFYRENGESVLAKGDYEVHCAARRVFRSNLKMTTEDTKNTQSNISVPQKTKLEGKEYQDFIGIMDLLCTR